MRTVFSMSSIKSPEEFADILQQSGMRLPLESSMKSLREPLILGGKTIQNRICIQPLEGFDSRDDGAPTQL